MKITIKNLQNKLKLRPARIKKLINHILKSEGRKESGCINICFVNNSLIKKFNIKFLKTNSSTDVLTFNLGNKKMSKILLADIMISTDTAINNARKFKTTSDYELMLYVAHGILHILGYDDRTKTQMKRMRKKEAEYVNR
jgi:probable rRNA maturation factor